jgi:hypothetical protein
MHHGLAGIVCPQTGKGRDVVLSLSNVRFWHLADILTDAFDVRFLG